jgi:hypothetical protein
MATLVCDWKHALIKPTTTPDKSQVALWEYLTVTRDIHVEVIESAPVGMVPAGYDPDSIIAEARKQVEDAQYRNQDDREYALTQFDFNFANPLKSICKSRAGWMVFFYQDAHEDVVSANFRQIEKDENGKNIVRMWSPLGHRGVFHPFIGGYTAVGKDGTHRVLISEGEFNQLEYLSAYAREYEEWKDEAYTCMTAGASSGVDQKTIWAALRGMTYEGEADLFPVVCEDGDEAGKKVTHTIAEGGFTYHFTLPGRVPVLSQYQKLNGLTPKPVPQDLDAYIRVADNDELAVDTVALLMSGAPIAYRPMAEIKAELDYIRGNPKLIENGIDPETGKGKQLPMHLLRQKVYGYVQHDLQTRARLMMAVYPYLYMTQTHKLIRVMDDSPAMASLFKEYGLLLTEGDTKLVLENLTSYMQSHATKMDVHKLGCILQLQGTSEYACYVNKGDGQAYKITALDIKVVDNGTDEVFLLEEGLTPWPELDQDNLWYMSELRKYLGKDGLKVRNSPLCMHYRAMYEAQELTQRQCEQLAFTRLMLHWLGNSVSLHPITVNIGIQNSGKSTQFEKFGKLLYGPNFQGSNLPADMRSLTAGLTNSAVCLYDNVDSADFSRGQAGFLDTFCGCATGMVASQAMLYHNNTELKFNLRNHLKLTSRVTPFNRSDAMRRTIQLTIRKPSPEEWISKDQMMAKLMADRDKCLLEVLVRLQNIVMAYNQPTPKHLMVSEMPEYETWTYKCADYEGFQPEMAAIWKAYRKMYEDAIADNNPLVYLVKLWLGQGNKSPNVRRKVTVTTLWTELNAICIDKGLKQTYTSVSSFKTHLTKNRSQLDTLGLREAGDTSSRLKWFEPTLEQVVECQREYRDLDSGPARRLGRWETDEKDWLDEGVEYVE